MPNKSFLPLYYGIKKIIHELTGKASETNVIINLGVSSHFLL